MEYWLFCWAVGDREEKAVREKIRKLNNILLFKAGILFYFLYLFVFFIHCTTILKIPDPHSQPGNSRDARL